MSKPLYKRLVAKSEKEADRYSKHLVETMHAIAKEVAKELDSQPKHIGRVAPIRDSRRMLLRVETRQPVDPAKMEEIQSTLSKHRRFFSISSAVEDNGFTISMYPTQPFGWQP